MTHSRHSDENRRESFYDAFLILTYGGPEKETDIAPFLDRLLAGKDVPAVSRRHAEEKYRHVGGVSPLGNESRHFAARLRREMEEAGISPFPTVYLGNLYSPPLLEETVRKIAENGHQSILVMAASPFGSPQSCRRYRQRLEAAVTVAGGITADTVKKGGETTNIKAEEMDTVVKTAGDILSHDVFFGKKRSDPPAPPRFYFIPPFFENSCFLKAQSDLILTLLAEDGLTHNVWKTEGTANSPDEPPAVLFSAHSLPQADADVAGYESQLLWVGGQIAESVGLGGRIPPKSEDLDKRRKKIVAKTTDDMKTGTINKPVWNLVFQSRSGRPDAPWTGPGIEEFIQEDQSRHPKRRRYLISPIGFFFENMETVVDLDVSLASLAEKWNLEIRRAPTVARNSEIIEMILNFLTTSPCFPQCGSPVEQCSLSCLVRPFTKKQ